MAGVVELPEVDLEDIGEGIEWLVSDCVIILKTALAQTDTHDHPGNYILQGTSSFDNFIQPGNLGMLVDHLWSSSHS